MARKLKIPTWVWVSVLLVVALYFGLSFVPSGMVQQCPDALYNCPGVGCVSGPDKCVPGNKGGPSKVFSMIHESFANETTTCPDNTRSQNGQCLLEFPSF
jgi:hypothetical protein